MLVGRSHECDEPPEVRTIPALTAQVAPQGLSPSEIDEAVARSVSSGQPLYRLDVPGLRRLRPELIVTQDLCSVCSIDPGSVRAAAAQLDPAPRVLCLGATSFEGVFDDLLALGEATGLRARAREAVIMLRERFFRAADYVNGFAARPRVAFLDWADPLYVGGHWTPQLVERAGGEHALNPTHAMDGAGAGAGGQMAHRVAGPSRRVSAEDLLEAQPEFLILCPCGVALRDVPGHLERLRLLPGWRDLPAVRTGRVAMVDGNLMFNRPGPRLVDGFEWLVGWLNDRPELIPPGFPWELVPAIRMSR
jgi:iron complex transport system substrate-binding protein